ncbi:MAG: EscU/YscU/HrcU family type III secretion system export apparatus switch protein [Bryobacteraceae bacterium]
MSNHDKTEQPTPRRRQKARDEGRYVTSRELVAAAQFVVFLSLLSSYSTQWFPAVRRLFRGLLEMAFLRSWSPSAVERLGLRIAADLGIPLVAAAGAVWLSGLAAQMATTRFGLSTTRLAPDLGRLNPASRLQAMPGENLGKLAVAVGVLPLFGAGLWWIWSSWPARFSRLPWSDLASGTGAIAQAVDQILWKAALLFIVVGVWDWVRQYRRWNTEMKMSKQEIRDEAKESEGNPHAKQKIRRMMREFSRRRMMSDVDTATAVIVNPTHYAVALRYEPGEMPAPKVVAKGRNYLALRIRERALRQQIPIVENPPLAQALYKAAHVGQEIPPSLYRAVAEVLAYIHRLMRAHSGGWTGARP